MNILVEYDALINNDIAICNIVQRDYPKLVRHPLNSNIALGSIVNRVSDNPLNLIAIHSELGNLDDYYNEVITKYEEEIIDKSFLIAPLIDYLKLLHDVEDIKIDVLCNNELHVKKIKNIKKYNFINPVIKDRYSDEYSAYVYKFIHGDICKSLKNKRIYFPNFKVNMLLISIISGMYPDNKYSILDVFKINNENDIKG